MSMAPGADIADGLLDLIEEFISELVARIRGESFRDASGNVLRDSVVIRCEFADEKDYGQVSGAVEASAQVRHIVIRRLEHTRRTWHVDVDPE